MNGQIVLTLDESLVSPCQGKVRLCTLIVIQINSQFGGPFGPLSWTTTHTLTLDPWSIRTL